MKAIRLKTEYLYNPVGIDINRPLLSWNCEEGLRQSACQILATDDCGRLLWDSGKTATSSMRAEWAGESVKPRTKVLWKVRLWDENDTPGDWAEASFETGLPKDVPWSAQWISGDYTPDKKLRYPVDCFRKIFTVTSHASDSATVHESPGDYLGYTQTAKAWGSAHSENAEPPCESNSQARMKQESIQKARLYICACGLYEAKLNGKKVGDFVLAPGYTDYRKRVQYQTYDVTELLHAGENVLTVQLADGWYRGSCGAWGLRNQYGTQTKLLAQLELTDAEGNLSRVCTDQSWQWSNDGPIRFADNKDGEEVDAGKTPSYCGVPRVCSHPVVPSASNNVPLTEHETLRPSLVTARDGTDSDTTAATPALSTAPDSKALLDFGQNIAGYLAFSLTAKAGQKIRLRFGEMLDEKGEFTQKNIQCSNKKVTTPLQEIRYTCKEGQNDYKTTFAIFGFQYVLIESDFPIDPRAFTAIAVYSDLERTAWFESSHPLLNRLFDCTLWSAKNNHADLPTDCPTRERHGWTGDAQIFCQTASFLFDYAAFARKYQRDLTDVQRSNGCFRQIVPMGGVDAYMNAMDGSAGWSDAGVLIPYTIFTQYGDLAILEDNYDAMCRYMRYKANTLGRHYFTSLPTGIRRKYRKSICNYGQSYGEWAEPADVKPFQVSDFISPHPEESTAYLVLLAQRMAEIAALLGHTADSREFSDIAQKAKEGYRHLVETKKHSLDTDRQAKLVRPLYLKLLDENQTNYAKKRLLAALEHYGWRLGTGFLSTPFILYVLADMDIEYAYRLLENEEIPGWLSMPKNGASTIWENWEGPGAGDKAASLNHYSKGAVFQWIFDTMCGIRVDGENHFTIAPRPGGHFTHAKFSYNSVYGMVVSEWEKKQAGIEFHVTVPAGCTALVRLPDGSERTQDAGVRIYSVV